jgi:porphobilinogen synthase
MTTKKIGLTVSLPTRPRRLRRTENIRRLVRETELSAKNFILPIFIEAGKSKCTEIKSLKGVYRYSLDELKPLLKEINRYNLPGIALFPKIDDKLKTPLAQEALNPKGLVPKAIELIKNECPDLVVITDVALDPYSSDGHDGLVKNNFILNDETLSVLGQMALVQSQAGADFVAPSDMMDGRVGYIRKTLDQQNQIDTGIIAYTAKYASNFYGPFRDALDSSPKKGDKKTYQMDFANSTEAIKEAKLDLDEGADILLVKPALAYLDIIYRLKNEFHLPIAAYHVSGEYAMIQAAADKGYLKLERAMEECLMSIKRAGADIIFSYYALEYLKARERQLKL